MPANRSQLPAIIRSTGRRLFSFIRSRVTNEADAQDILQDVWGKLIESLEEGPIEQVGAWLSAVARNRIVDGYRKVRPASVEALAAGGGEEGETGDMGMFIPLVIQAAPSEEWRDQFWQALAAALAELPAEQRQVFVWHELEEMSFKDMEALTGEKLNTLLSRKRYAVMHLRQRLLPWLDEIESSDFEVT